MTGSRALEFLYNPEMAHSPWLLLRNADQLENRITGGSNQRCWLHFLFVFLLLQKMSVGVFLFVFQSFMKSLSQSCTYRICREGRTHTESHNEYGGELYTYLTRTMQEKGSTILQLTEAVGNNEKGEQENEGWDKKTKGKGKQLKKKKSGGETKTTCLLERLATDTNLQTSALNSS